MNRQETDALIRQALHDTGVRLEPDDPLIAVLLAQKRMINAYEQAGSQHLAEHARAFQAASEEWMRRFEQTAGAVIQSADEMKKQRNHMMMEILRHNQSEIDQTEKKLSGSISQHIRRETGHTLRTFTDSLNRRLLILFLSASAAQILLVALLLAAWLRR